MNNVSHNAGLTPVTLSNNVLNNTPSKILAQVNSFTNYEAVLKDLASANTVAPTFILAMGDGSSNIPKNSSYEFDFYSAYILGRTGYNNAWVQNYQKSEKYTISYFDGSTVFKRFSIENETGKLLGRSIELRNGNIPFTSANTQLVFGWASDSKINETSTLRHSFKTVHSQTIASENAMDIYLWNPVNDQPTSMGSRHVARFNGIGNFEIIRGSEVMGGVAQALSTTPTSPELVAEQTALAITGKGVLYYNSVLGRFRYSENGSQFYFLGNGSGSAVVNLPATQIAIGNGPTGLISSSGLTFTGGNLITTGTVTGAGFITSGNISGNTLNIATTATIGGNVTITSLPTGLVKSVNGLLTSVSGISEIPGISIGVNQIAYGTGTGITGSNSFTYVQSGGMSALTVGDTSAKVGRVILKNGYGGASEHNFGIMWATSANPMLKFDQGLGTSWEAITFYSAESPKRIYFNANGDFNGTLKVSSLGSGTSLVKSVAGVLTNASASDVLSAISINVGNTQIAVGNGTGLVGSSSLTFNSGILAITGSATISSTLTVTGLSGLVKATAGVLGNATFSDIPGITISPNQVAYGNTSSGVTSSSNFTFDGNQATIHNSLTSSSALSVSGGQSSAAFPSGYGIGVHISTSTSYGAVVELNNGTTSWRFSNKNDDVLRISRGNTDVMTHDMNVGYIRGNVQTNSLYLSKTYSTVATVDAYYPLTNTSGYWVIPTGLNNMKIKLPASPVEGTMFCIFHLAKNGSTAVTEINGNGKNILGYVGAVSAIVTTNVDYRATILVYDESTDIWYAYQSNRPMV
jgi:hypothetical protein